jgi:NAD(P)-dependent dehydrogenase (short-subunit alcohol dehydrogenase family)
MNVVITGSTRGIGLGLAREFLARGHPVLIAGRNEAAVAETAEQLSRDFPQTRVHGKRCDVNVDTDLRELWDEASDVFDSVDIWINNAGINNPKQKIYEMPLKDIESTLETNLISMVRASVIALRGMLAQGSGWIWNMEGFGSEGMIGVDQVPYGLSKYGLRYFTKALVKTVKDSPVKVGYLSPGIVTTRMAVPEKDERGDFFFQNMKFLNILSDHVETVTPWLVEQMLAADRNGAAIRWMTTPKAAWRFISSLWSKRHVIEEAMERTDRPD